MSDPSENGTVSRNGRVSVSFAAIGALGTVLILTAGAAGGLLARGEKAGVEATKIEALGHRADENAIMLADHGGRLKVVETELKGVSRQLDRLDEKMDRVLRATGAK